MKTALQAFVLLVRELDASTWGSIAVLFLRIRLSPKLDVKPQEVYDVLRKSYNLLSPKQKLQLRTIAAAVVELTNDLPK